MSDISLLMTGIAVKGQQPPETPPIELHQEVQALAPISLSPSSDQVTISAPEFLPINNKTPLLPLLIQPEIKSLLSHFVAILRTKELTNSTFVQNSLAIVKDAQTNLSVNQNVTLESDKTQRLRSQLISDGSSILAKYGSSRNQGLPVLGFGNTGISVRVLQRLLASNGYAISIDGEFGALTEAAVKAFQSQREIVTDGIVGRVTWSELTQ